MAKAKNYKGGGGIEGMSEAELIRRSSKAYDEAMPEADTTFGNLPKRMPKSDAPTQNLPGRFAPGTTMDSLKRRAPSEPAMPPDTSASGTSLKEFFNRKAKPRKDDGMVPLKSGGKVSSASSRADGCATKGKTKGRMV